MPSESSTTPNAYSVDFWRSCMRVTASCATCAESVEPRGLRVGEARAEASGHEATALKEGRSFRIFTNSMSEFWEDLRELDGPRRAALATMRETPHLTWMILTSRPEAILGLLKKAHNEALAEQSLRSSENGHRFVQWLKDWLAGWQGPEERLAGHHRRGTKRSRGTHQSPAGGACSHALPILRPLQPPNCGGGQHPHLPLQVQGDLLPVACPWPHGRGLPPGNPGPPPYSRGARAWPEGNQPG